MEKKTSKFLRGEILSSICYIVLGLCLVLIPDQTVNIICKVVFGLVMIAAGIYHIVIYAAEKEKATVLDLFTGVIAAVLGVFLFFEDCSECSSSDEVTHHPYERYFQE